MHENERHCEVCIWDQKIKLCRKSSAADKEWLEDEEKGEKISYSIIEIKTILLNFHAECGWCLCFEAEWNNKMLQSEYDVENKNDEEDLGNENDKLKNVVKK